MLKACLAALAAALAALPAGALMAQDSPPAAPAPESPLAARAADVVGVINGEIAPEAVFTPAFLAQVPAAQFKALSQQLTAQFGAALAVESLDPPTGNQAALAIRMERAIARGSIAIDPAAGGRVSGLLFQTFDPVGDSPEKIAADLAALPGTVSAWFGPLGAGEPVLSIAPDTPLAIGSTFKLYVLAALAEEIAAGQRRWSDVVRLDMRSFPSGQMQDWPQGAPVTLHTLASMMISISDNTATDQLIKVVGRDKVLALLARSGHAAPARNTPFLTTRELFLLKGGDPARLAAYQAGDARARAAILANIESAPVTLTEIGRAFSGGPVALDVEWLASAEDLARLLKSLAASKDPEVRAIMAINPSATPGVRAKWDYVGYKGGSEPGVLNYTWLLTDKAGRDHALVLTWNNPDAALQETTLELIGQRILALAPE